MRFLVLSTFCGSFPLHAPGIGLSMKYEDDILLTKSHLHTFITAMSSLVLVEISSGRDTVTKQL